MVVPLNTQKNRELNLVSSQGQLLQNKHGMIYFKLQANGNSVYLKCDKGNFENHFRADENLNEDKPGDAAEMKNVFVDYITAKKNAL